MADEIVDSNSGGSGYVNIEVPAIVPDPVVSNFDQFKQLTDGLFRKLLAIGLLYFIMSFLFKVGMKSFDQGKWDILLMILTALLNIGGMLLAFYFASTQSSQDKDKRIDKVIDGGDNEKI